MADSVSLSTQDRSSSTGEIVGTGLHLNMVPAHKLKIQNKPSGLPELPSHQFEYSRWHDVKDVEITGDQMRAPRVRIAPAQDTKLFRNLKDENEELIHHSLKGRQKTQHRKSLANWEKCEFVSLCYQELCDKYQRANFYTILKSLKVARQINLMDNLLTDLGSYSFPRCEDLNLNGNYISSFKKLPKIPCIVTLSLADNGIGNFDGLNQLSSTPIKHLVLLRTPIWYTIGYRQRIFQALPQLEVLDNIPKLDSDSVPPGEVPSRCSIS
ncbi:hypothetical protein ScPMuIL_008218 [Solemya velum]